MDTDSRRGVAKSARSASTPLTPRGEDKRARILEAAGELLASQGYAGTTLSDIAAAAGTYAGSLYYHFANREELATEVLTAGAEAAMAHTRGVIETLPTGVSARRRLEAAIEAHVEFMLARSPAAMASARAVGQLPPPVAEPLAAVHRAYGQLFADLFDDAAAEGSIDPSVDLSAARMLVLGAANWTAEWFDPDGSASAETVAALLCRLTFDGLGTGRRGRRSR
ncbi:MAG: TetR/AcrR family transcriptional regulator [Acidimicrobiales bacterium]